MCQLFASGSQSIGASALASILPMNIQGWFPYGLTGLNSLQSRGFSSLLQHHDLKVSILQCSVFFTVQLSHPYMTPRKTIPLTIWTFVSKIMSLLFITMSIFVIAFLTKSKHLLICASGAQENKYVTVSTFPLFICHEVMGPDDMILMFRMLSFKLVFNSLLSYSSRNSLVLLHFLSLEWYYRL